MADKCYTCGTVGRQKPENISFTHQRMTVKIFKSGMRCAECARKEWIKEFSDIDAKEFINVADGLIKINWQKYTKYFESGRMGNEKNKLHAILMDIGILSHEAKNNWEIVADGPIGLNPRAFWSYLYFTRREDAVEFARLARANTLYEWDIRQIGEVISKQNVIKKQPK